MPTPLDQHLAVNTLIDELAKTYDSRMVAAILLRRASELYNALWRSEIITTGQLARVYDVAGDIATDREHPPVPLLHTNKPRTV